MNTTAVYALLLAGLGLSVVAVVPFVLARYFAGKPTADKESSR
jgi:hypothetical protein